MELVIFEFIMYVECVLRSDGSIEQHYKELWMAFNSKDNEIMYI